jgi:hypothetical protein
VRPSGPLFCVRSSQPAGNPFSFTRGRTAVPTSPSGFGFGSTESRGAETDAPNRAPAPATAFLPPFPEHGGRWKSATGIYHPADRSGNSRVAHARNVVARSGAPRRPLPAPVFSSSAAQSLDWRSSD